MTSFTTDASTGTNVHIIIEPTQYWLGARLKEIWQYRELLYFLTWRDIKLRYRQTLLGAVWAILQPVFTMLVFSIIFGQFAKLPSEGVPYPLFTFAALLPWQLFAFALTQSSNSLVGSQNLISKVYFPRLIIPVAATIPALVDFLISFLVLVVMMIIYGMPFTLRMLALPLFLGLALLSALAMGIWLSALNVEYRDVRYIIPFLTQFWMYVTPVAYSTQLVPEQWRLVYWLNPMTGVIEGFRWALLGGDTALNSLIWVSAGIVLLLFAAGLWYFNQVEDTFADVI